MIDEIHRDQLFEVYAAGIAQGLLASADPASALPDAKVFAKSVADLAEGLADEVAKRTGRNAEKRKARQEALAAAARQQRTGKADA